MVPNMRQGVFFLAILTFVIWCAALAAPSYPVPFVAKPDWHGFTSVRPSSQIGIVPQPVLRHSVVVILKDAKSLGGSDESVGRLAYDTLTSDLRQIPPGPAYIVVILYGRVTTTGLYPDYAYIFRRDAVGWKTRLVSSNELLLVECAVGHCPNY